MLVMRLYTIFILFLIAMPPFGFICMGCSASFKEKRGYRRHTQSCIRFKLEVRRLATPSAAIPPAVAPNVEVSMEEVPPDFEEPTEPSSSGNVNIEMNEPPPVRSTLLRWL